MINKNQTQTISGIVVMGQNKGPQTGAHTANLDLSLVKNLSRGLYSCSVELHDKTYLGLLYYGHNSLSQKDCLEVHILNFYQDIYGQKIEVAIKKFLRPEKKFNSIEELKKQIKKDLEMIKK